MIQASDVGQPYVGAGKRHILHLIRTHKNLAHVLKILNAAPGTLEVEERNLNIMPQPIRICYPTLLRFARDNKIPRRGRGRPKTK